jgi:hypothetical protein
MKAVRSYAVASSVRRPSVHQKWSSGGRVLHKAEIAPEDRINLASVREAAPTKRSKHEGVTVSPAPIKTSSNRGRPIVHTEPWAKITVVLLDRHVAYLDRLAIDIRLKHGKAISRAEIIRGLIEASFQSGIDLSDASSIDSIVELMNAPKKRSR